MWHLLPCKSSLYQLVLTLRVRFCLTNLLLLLPDPTHPNLLRDRALLGVAWLTISKFKQVGRNVLLLLRAKQ